MSDVQDWKATLPPEYKDAPALKDVKDVPMLVKNYLEAQSAIGGSVRMPSKEAGEEGRKAFRSRILEVGKDYGVTVLPGEDEKELEAFYTSMGRPVEAKAYELPDIKAENLKIVPEEAEQFKVIAHAAGLTAKQYKKIVADTAKGREANALVTLGKFNEAHAALKTEWGQAYDNRRAETIKRLESQKAPAGLIDAFKNNLVDADSTRWLYGVMTALGDEPHELASQGKQTSGTKLTPSEAYARVAEVEKRLEAMAPGDPEYTTLMNRRVELIGIAAGTE